jgi:signal transduction histidine kinase
MRGTPEAGGRARVERRSAGLATRVWAALVLVVLAGDLTAWLVGSLIAPAIFADHMHRAGASVRTAATAHAEEAFQAASGISLTAALLASLAVCLGVSLYLTRRLVRSLQPVVAAAAEVAAGRYEVRLGRPGLGGELNELADAFNEMAGQLDRVEETRRRMLADLAHEMRTPVATLGAYLEAIEDGVAPLGSETITVMQAQISRLSRLAEDVGALSRAEESRRSLQRELVDPAALVGTVCAAVADRYVARGVRLDTRLDTGLPKIRVDPDRAGQVLGNLLDNALRYTAAGGRVLVSAEGRADVVRLSVADDGQGIAPQHLPHVFERFYRADAARDRAHGGSGIGLAIVKALVEAHDGRVAVLSEGQGRGATFTVDLPRAEAHD